MKQIPSPDWLVPVVPGGLILEDHSLVMVAERIEAILPSDKALASYPDAVETKLPN